MSVITESGMNFRVDDEKTFRIEESEFMRRHNAVKSVEYIELRKGRIVLVEAKSSFPKVDGQTDFNKNVSDISEKFAHSLEYFISCKMGYNKCKADEIPAELADCDMIRDKGLDFILVINCTGMDRGVIPHMLSVIQDAFTKKMRAVCEIWNATVKVIDRELAVKLGIAAAG